ncbi:hypothetical protein BH18ACT1_BH18ACT1_04480 [soil metagenome]
MKVHIEIDRPRWLPRLSTGRRRVVAALAVIGLVAAPAGVLASDRFSDIPTASPSHGTVDKIADAGIVRGCDDGTTFCPGRNLTRLEMAQFMARGAGSAGYAKTDASGGVVGTANATTIIQLDVSVAGIPSNTQRVKIDADVTVLAPATSDCPCQLTLYLQDESGTQVSANHVVTLVDPTGAAALGDATSAAASLSLVAPQDTGTEETYFLAAQADTAYTPALRAYGDLTATVFPFSN